MQRLLETVHVPLQCETSEPQRCACLFPQTVLTGEQVLHSPELAALLEAAGNLFCNLPCKAILCAVQHQHRHS